MGGYHLLQINPNEQRWPNRGNSHSHEFHSHYQSSQIFGNIAKFPKKWEFPFPRISFPLPKFPNFWEYCKIPKKISIPIPTNFIPITKVPKFLGILQNSQKNFHSHSH